MKVLVACEYSGRVRDAFIKRGCDAVSCDILPTDSPGPHYQGDVFDIIEDNFDLLIAHPPCTYLSNSGVCHLYTEPGRWIKMELGSLFFKKLLGSKIKRKVIENPIQHGYARNLIGRKYSQIIQPWMFGHPETKATCLWLEELPLLKATNNVKEYMLTLPKNQRERLHYLPPTEDRWKLRSETFQGIADALADQYGELK